MKRYQPPDGNTSLELLLDTICNTFGGILLISLLVAVLLNATSKAVDNEVTSPKSQAELLAAEIERERVERELEGLRESVDNQRAVTDALLPSDLIEEAHKYQKAAQQHAELVTRKTTKVGDASQAQLRINELTRDTADRKAKLAEARQQAAELDKELEKTVTSRSREAAIPRLSEATTEQDVYFVVNQRLYGPWEEGQFNRFNETDFILKVETGKKILQPKPGGGIPIPSATDDKTALKKKLADVNKTSEHAVVLVWPDSFGEFDVVRQALAEEDIKLDLMPWPEGKEVTVGQQREITPSQVQ
jgi:hypothetical protein